MNSSNKIVLIVLLIILLLQMFSCRGKIDAASINNSNSSNNAEFDIVLQDSIIFKNYNYPLLIITDYLKENEFLVGFDLLSNKLIEFDKKGNINSVLDFNKDGIHKISSTILAIGKIDINATAILTRNGLHILNKNDLSHRFIKSKYLLNGRSSDFRLQVSFKNNDTLFYFKATLSNDTADLVMSILDLQNYKIKPLTSVDFKNSFNLVSLRLSTNKFVPLLKYPSTSEYNHEQGHLPEFSLITEYQLENIYVLFKNEAKIWLYSENNNGSLNLIDSLKLNPDFYTKPELINYNKEYSMLDKERIRLANLEFHNIYVNKDTILYSYSPGLPLSKSLEYNSTDELFKYFSSNYQEYIQVLINGQKIGHDIKLPPNTKSVSYFTSTNELILSRNDKLGELPYDMVYVYKLNLKKVN